MTRGNYFPRKLVELSLCFCPFGHDGDYPVFRFRELAFENACCPFILSERKKERKRKGKGESHVDKLCM